jgi:hypothetical protein
MTTTSGALGHWRRLRSALGQDGDLGIPSVELSIDLEGGTPRLAVGQGGDALLLIPLAPAEPFPDLMASRAIGIRESMLSVRGEGRRFVELACLETRLEGVFEQLVEEIVRRLAAGEAPAPAVSGTLEEFRDLLERPASAWSMERAIGLIGELRVLNDLLSVAPTAWRAWTGPAAGRHDFRAGRAAIECKTSRRTAAGTVTISAIDQLEPPPDGALQLRALVIEPDPAGDLSIDGLASEALTAASDAAGLRAQLELVGWSPVSSDWTAMRFSILHDTAYGVVEGFPRLVRQSLAGGDLPPGVTAVSYSIQLDLADRFRMDAVEASALLEIVAHAA